MWYWIFSLVFSGIFKIFFRLQVEGLENIPRKSNFIIIANHSSFLDPAVIMAAVRRKIHCVAIRDIYRFSWLSWFLKVTETLPIGSSSQKAIDLLAQNKNIGLFPEGGVSRDGKLKEFRRGAALLAYKSGRPIVHCAIIGTFESIPLGRKIPRLRKLKLKIGRPVYFAKEFEDIIDDLYLQEGMFKLRGIIKGMLDAG
ncbi:MAG: lysophospholipid acyltransferase family protein [Candidatus Omnitrophota bacterium]